MDFQELIKRSTEESVTSLRQLKAAVWSETAVAQKTRTDVTLPSDQVVRCRKLSDGWTSKQLLLHDVPQSIFLAALESLSMLTFDASEAAVKAGYICPLHHSSGSFRQCCMARPLCLGPNVHLA
jgi:hypothetical protein